MPVNCDEMINGRLQTLDADETSRFVHRDELNIHPHLRLVAEGLTTRGVWENPRPD